jgi:pimeloyl-ACP methyl ester carboxylesterase
MPDLQKVTVNGAQLHYLQQGSGPPLVLVHGGLDDHRYWLPHLEPLSAAAAVTAYSRRYNHPNENPEVAEPYSPALEARDLAALLQALSLPPAHLVGSSSGAYAVLLCALQQPQLVRSATLCEPPLLAWLPRLPGGQPLYDDIMENMWRPAAAFFRRGQDEAALRAAVAWFLGTGMVPGVASFDEIPAGYQDYLRSNAREFKVWMTSPEPFPDVEPARVQGLRVPVLLLSGQRTAALHKLIDAELERLLPQVERRVIPGATHDMWNVNPQACQEALLEFLRRRPPAAQP